MRKLLLLSLLFAAACRTAEVPSSSEEGSPPVWKEENTPAPNQVAQETPKKGLISKIFGHGKPETQIPSGLKKCKNCTFLAPGATATTIGKKATAATAEGATATQTGKKAGPTVVGDSSTLNAVTGSGIVGQITGDGNTPNFTNAPQEAPGIGATIAAKLTGPLGIVLGLAVAGLLAYGVVRYRATRKIIS